MGFLKKHARRFSKQVEEATGSKTVGDYVTGAVGGVYAGREAQRGRKQKEEKHHSDLFDFFTRMVSRGGGHIPSKVAETATSVRSAQGSPVARSRQRSVFVIPRKRKKGVTSEAVGLNIPQSGGLVI